MNWLRRCVEDRNASGQFILRQETNAYAVLPPTQWNGYSAPAVEPPPPKPSAWGAVPPLPPLLDQALQVGGACEYGAALSVLEQDPDDPLIAALAHLGRSMREREPHRSSGVRN